MKTFYLIDGHSQIFRAYYAPFNVLTSPSGEPVKATYIFTQMILAIIRDQKPEYLAMAVDVSDSTTLRTAVYADYKANRDSTPEDLPPQVDRILEIVETCGIPIFRKEGYEADDLIATIAGRLADADVEVRIVSRDKDLHQLLTDRVKLWDPMKDEIIDAASLEKLAGYTPQQAVEIQTLMGDAIDNVPGIPGVGPKTAISLIKKYGTAEGVVAHAAELTPKLRENVQSFASRLAISRQLVTLDRSVTFDFDLERCRVKPLPAPQLRDIFQRLGFRRLIDQLDTLAAPRPSGSPSADSPATRSPESEAPLEPDSGSLEGGPDAPLAPAEPLGGYTVTQPGHYKLIDSEEAFEELLARLAAVPYFAIDTETTSLKPRDSQLVGISLSWEAGDGYYLPFRSRAGKTLDPARAAARLRPILEDPAKKKCGQNLKFDIQTLRTEGIELQGVAMDSMVASYIVRPDARAHNMDSLAIDLLGHRTIPITDLIGRGKNQISMLDVDTRRLADYAAEDADISWRLCEKLALQVDSSPMKALFYEVEMPLIGVLADMEYTGITLDAELLRAASRSMRLRLEALRDAIHRTAGRIFTIDSPRQLAGILFDELKLRVVKKTKTSRSTDAEVLELLVVESAHPLPALVLEYRELSKLCGTYVEPLPTMLSPSTGRLHAGFHQTVAATGRLSSSDPNIQNIPIRSVEGREIRKAFIARDAEHSLVTADYSQVELRILAHLSNDEALVRAFEEDQDIHAAVAAQVWGVPIADVTREQRSRAKAINFGIIYGQGAFGLARSLGIAQSDAAQFIAAYKRRHPGIVRFMERCVEEAAATGRVSTMLGRQRAVPEVLSENRARRSLGERLAINTVVQGTAADLIKVAMVRIHERLQRERSPAQLLIQVHDELVLEAPRSMAAETAELVRSEMAGALALKVPLRVDVGVGQNWLEAKGD